jgi:putative tricarboxylic transport membrane protein
MFESVMGAVTLLFTVNGVLWLSLGVVIGLVFGAIPGLGGTTAIALLTPLTFGMQPYEAITLIGGVMGSVAFGGSISAILLNTPGIAPNAATCFDGYPLAQQGKAGMAIGAAATASSLGGLIGVVILVAVIPIAKQIVLLFGPPEFFMLAIAGLATIALSTGGQFLRGLIAGGIGLALAFVGYDAVSGGVRFTADFEYLFDGIPLVPTLTGLFAISEMINLTVKGGIVASSSGRDVAITRVSDGVWAVFRNWPTLLRGSAIGAFVGAVPGVGGTVASFLSYAATVQVSRDPDSFGKGNIQGVIAPEAANNAKDGGALIPTLAFGIPGSAEMAIFLGVLILHGLDPGPMLLIENEGVIFSLILALAVAAVLASAIGLAMARVLSLITLVDVHMLVPAVCVVALVGVYALHSAIGDVVLAAIFGGIGYLMIRFNYPRITLVIALVLGELAERNFHQALMISDNDWTIFFTRGISLGLFVLIIAVLLAPALRLLLRRRTRGAEAR